MSKRKLVELIEGNEPKGCNRGKYVKGWDDPRLFTLVGLRRRGIPPQAILSFVKELGVTKAKTTIDVKRLEQSVRSYLESTVPRLMLVMDPIPVIIDNLPEDYVEMIELPFSKDPNHGVSTPHAVKKFAYLLRRRLLICQSSPTLFHSLIPSTLTAATLGRKLRTTFSGLRPVAQLVC